MKSILSILAAVVWLALPPLIGAMLLSGCVSMTEPVQVSQDTYMIGLGARGGFSSDADLLAQTIKAAGAFCESKNRSIEVQSTNTSGVQMWTPQSNEVTFKCVPILGKS